MGHGVQPHVVADAGLVRQQRVSQRNRLEARVDVGKLRKRAVRVLLSIVRQGVEGLEFRPGLQPVSKCGPIMLSPTLNGHTQLRGNYQQHRCLIEPVSIPQVESAEQPFQLTNRLRTVLDRRRNLAQLRGLNRCISNNCSPSRSTRISTDAERIDSIIRFTRSLQMNPAAE
jgi:hypothetical protein